MPSCTSTVTRGLPRLNSASACGTSTGATTSSVPMTIRPAAPSLIAESSARAWSRVPSISRAWRMRLAPCAVGVRPREVRRKSLSSSVASRSPRSRVAAGWVMCSAAAALCRLLCSSIAASSSTWRIFSRERRNQSDGSDLVIGGLCEAAVATRGMPKLASVCPNS